jgi:HK97 family phage major capsid protein
MSVTDTSGHLVWSPDPQSIVGSVPSTLFGKPVLISEKRPSLGSTGDLILVSLSNYAIGLRGQIRVESTNVASWLTDKVDIRVLLRVDGMGLWDKAITPMSGGDTKSWCVVLSS